MSSRSDRAIHSLSPREEREGERRNGERVEERGVCECVCARVRKKRDCWGGGVLMHCFS